MKNILLLHFVAIVFASFLGCQEGPAWEEVTPQDKEQLSLERQDYIDRGLIISREAWLELGLKDAKTPEDFDDALSKLPHGIETRYNEASPRSIFQYAVLTEKDKKCIEYLIDQGAKIDQRDFEGNTPLHTAVRLGNLEIAKLLLKNDADPNASDVYGYTSIFHCIIYTKPEKLVEMYDLLIEYGANPLVYIKVQGASDTPPTPYGQLKYRFERFGDPEVKELLAKMATPPRNLH